MIDLKAIEESFKIAEQNEEILFNEMVRIAKVLGTYYGEKNDTFCDSFDNFWFEEDSIHFCRRTYDQYDYDMKIKYSWFSMTDEELLEVKELLEIEKLNKEKTDKIKELMKKIKDKKEDIKDWEKELKKLK